MHSRQRLLGNVNEAFVKHISTYYAESYDKGKHTMLPDEWLLYSEHLMTNNKDENQNLTKLFDQYDMFNVR